MSFGDALRYARIEADLTQTEFARCIGVSFSNINRYENGHHVPTPNVLNAIRTLSNKKRIEFIYDPGED